MKLRFALLAVLASLCLLCLPMAAQTTLYTNGPINGTVDAWSFAGQYGWEVADSFLMGSQGTVTGFSIGAWVVTGDTPANTGWEILSGNPSWGGGTVIASGTANFSNTYWGQYGGSYDIYTSTVSGLNVNLSAGTYWLQLMNGTTAANGNIYWDENDGPSSAQQGSYGNYYQTMGSEAFTISGTTSGGGGTVPEPSSLLLLGSGVVGLAGILRRKISL